jgi:hypothetical protein
MYCLQTILPNNRSVRYNGLGQIQVLAEDDVTNIEDFLITVYDKDGSIGHILLSATGEKFGFDYIHRLAFLHSTDLRNIPYWGIDLESSVALAEADMGDMLDRGHINSSISIRYIGVLGDSGVDVGYGIFAEEEIKMGTLIGEYVGVVFQASTSSSSCYALNYPCKVGGYVIDSNETGNIIRMVNHSDNHNSSFQNIFHDNMMHVICVSHALVCLFVCSFMCVCAQSCNHNHVYVHIAGHAAGHTER